MAMHGARRGQELSAHDRESRWRTSASARSSFVLAFPVVWMAITALKQNADLYPDDAIPFWFKLPPTWDNFDLLLHKTQFVQWTITTAEIAILVVVDHGSSSPCRPATRWRA